MKQQLMGGDKVLRYQHQSKEQCLKYVVGSHIQISV